MPRLRNQRLQFAHFRLGEGTVHPVAQVSEIAQARVALRIEEDIVGDDGDCLGWLQGADVQQVIHPYAQDQRDGFKHLDVGPLHPAVLRERRKGAQVDGQAVARGDLVAVRHGMLNLTSTLRPYTLNCSATTSRLSVSPATSSSACSSVRMSGGVSLMWSPATPSTVPLPG